MFEYDHDDRRIAFHEAGHAVAAVLLGLGCDEVRIGDAEQDAGGHAAIRSPYTLPSWVNPATRRSVVENFVIAQYAGAATDKVRNVVGGWSSDYATARQWIADHLSAEQSEEAVRTLELALRERALAFVKAHQTAIVRVANELVRARVMWTADIEYFASIEAAAAASADTKDR